jgi:uncharacterized protein (DUF2252 family)
MKSPVAITLQTGGPALVDVSANEKRSVLVVALAPAAIMSVGAREAARVAVTARMSLRICVFSFLAGRCRRSVLACFSKT